jgi:hypothetical protein
MQWEKKPTEQNKFYWILRKGYACPEIAYRNVYDGFILANRAMGKNFSEVESVPFKDIRYFYGPIVEPHVIFLKAKSGKEKIFQEDKAHKKLKFKLAQIMRLTSKLLEK